MKLPLTEEDRKIVTLVAAAVITHADVSCRGLPLGALQHGDDPQKRIDRAFDFAERWVEEAIKRLGKT